ncbi:MAG: pyridoxamine 5'-phosphate oxidase family protein [Alphaproteobacteria bacterium]|nr:pyridoxamine 5'-phosphate oxidase family protein [Alphaproteobacteria bacterium]
MYHDGNRTLQDRFGSRPLADRLLQITHRTAFTADDRAFIEAQPFFFLATASPEGAPDCSFKGGAPGFVRVVGDDRLVFADYDGNGMFKSLGNIAANPQVGLLFMTMSEAPKRLRVNGRAALAFDGDELDGFAGGQVLVQVTAEHIFPNCPRYIPDAVAGTPSAYVPEAGELAREPAWKSFGVFQDVVPPRSHRADPSNAK